MFKLLSNPTDNPKTSKNVKLNVLTSPLHLAPYNLSGYQVCPMASTGCSAACLHTAGNPAFMHNKNKGRIRKTKLFFEDRPTFFVQLIKDIHKLQKVSLSRDMDCGVRLNATSDISWESIKIPLGGDFKDKTIFEVFPDVIFYDYTKIPKRTKKTLPDNYHLTFSLSEDNDKDAEYALNNGTNVAVVFDTKRNRELPQKYTIGTTEAIVIDGDEHDYRPFDDLYKTPKGYLKGVIVGLRAKGDAIGDKSGFVRNV